MKTGKHYIQVFIQVFIESEDDLPKEKGWYYCGTEQDPCFSCVEFDPDQSKNEGIELFDYDWYLLPVESTLSDEEIEAIEFIAENPDCEKYWLSKVRHFMNSKGEPDDDSCQLADEWQKQFEIAINAFLKWAKDKRTKK